MQRESQNPKPSRTLAAGLAMAFLTLSVAVLLIAGGIEIYFSFQTHRETIAGKQQLIAQRAANAVASFIQEKFSVLEATARLGVPTADSSLERRKVLRTLMGLQPAFRQVVLLDTQEQILSQTSRLSRIGSGNILERFERNAYLLIRQGDRYIGSVYVDEVTSEPLIIIAVPVTNLLGDFQGTLMAEVNLKFMWQLVDRLKIGRKGLAYVVDRRGNLIAFGDISRVLGAENVGHLKEVAEFISNTEPLDRTGATAYAGINGNLIVGTYVPLGTPDWAVVIELPLMEAYGDLIWNTVSSSGVLLIMAALAGLVGSLVARRLAVPLRNLTDTAARIARGETELQAALEGPAEVISLAKAFNDMTGRLHEMLSKEEERTRNLQKEIEQRIEAEEALRQSQQRYRNIFETASVSLLEEDISELRTAIDRLQSEGIRDFREYFEEHPEFVSEVSKMIKIKDVNEEALRLYDAQKKEVLLKSLDNLFTEETLPVFKEALIAVAEGKSHFEAETVNRTLQGRPIHILMKVTIPDRSDNTDSMLVSMMDITGRKLAEGELERHKEHLEELVEERTKELEAAQDELMKSEKLAVLGQLTATVSHELRNPLWVIRSSSFYLQKKYEGQDEKIKKHMNRIEDQVEICNSIVADLLEYTRGRHSQTVEGEINPWLDHVLDEIPEVGGVKIEKVMAGTLPKVFFDPEKIRRVVVNLVNNALQAVNERKLIEKDDAYQPIVEVSSKGTDDGVLIMVKDNGIGMDEETMGRASEPLFTTRARGTGLGLAVVQKILEEHGGTVSIESTFEKGDKSVNYTTRSP